MRNNRSMLVLFVGRSTCFVARLAALAESDFKKIIALSTLSQLGLMFLSLGIGSWLYCWIHLLIHAYFKALIFIIAGIVIHDSNSYQSLKSISLRLKASPLLTSILASSSLRLIGLPFMSGFYSKDLILESLSASGKSYMMAV